MTVSAPGKIVLLGDYAVLEGGLAIAAAVNRRATGALVDEMREPSPVVREVCARASASAVASQIAIDTHAFQDELGQKLGLGSSAAVAVVSAALATGAGDENTLRVAIEGHRDAAGGEGSGVDVAASFHGGVIAARRQPAVVEPLTSRVPGLELSVLYTGASASTPELVRACRASPKWSEWIRTLEVLSEAGYTAWRKGDARAFVEVVARYGRAMAGLGRDAEVEVVTPTIQAVMDAALAAGGAAKPSGAGGGDVVVMWTRTVEDAVRVAEAAGVKRLDIAIDPRGLSR